MTLRDTMTQSPPGSDNGKDRSLMPARSAGDLESLAGAFAYLGRMGSEKMTVRTSLFFLAVAYAHVMRQNVTMTSIQELYSDGSLGLSVQKSYQIFLPPDRKHPDRLGWIEQVPDEDDRRVKWLRLTEAGEEIAADLVEALRGH